MQRTTGCLGRHRTNMHRAKLIYNIFTSSALLIPIRLLFRSQPLSLSNPERPLVPGSSLPSSQPGQTLQLPLQLPLHVQHQRPFWHLHRLPQRFGPCGIVFQIPHVSLDPLYFEVILLEMAPTM
ncbi:hypothetical protein I7I50_08964 [Histoplasma capsulatum G186AR]|uniref:Uncharacterized protein n=1 Tax=Ajellomyces capsulatus TaxID=5037 RepID=A0A8H8CZB5_AJECA|nr:hypothetical protein I7I52_06479 [Histoplasma capsulatum]QSS73994.1 hypothetical protein I7I50_08964 [Histoplasma capsulatum G186AR]